MGTDAIPSLAETPGRQVGQMSPRAWAAACLLAAFFGGIVGWSARVATADHRYIRALAEKHESESRYWSRKTDQIINENEIERRKRDGKSSED